MSKWLLDNLSRGIIMLQLENQRYESTYVSKRHTTRWWIRSQRRNWKTLLRGRPSNRSTMAWTKWKPAPKRHWLYEAPAFLLGDSKGVFSFAKENTPFALRPMGRIFSRNFSKNWKKTKNDWPSIAGTEVRSRVSHDEYLDLSYSIVFLPFFQGMAPSITYSGFHSRSILNTGVPVVFTCLTVHIRECCAMDKIGTIGSSWCESLVHWSHPFCDSKDTRKSGENQAAERIKMQDKICA